MKHVFLILMAFASTGYAVGARVSVKVDAASNTIPTSAATGDAGSKMTNITRAAVDEITCYNGTASAVAINVEDGSSASAPTEADYTMAASTGITFKGHIGAALYIWSDSGSTISSGVVRCMIHYKY